VPPATDLSGPISAEIEREQAVLDSLHELLDRERADAQAHLDRARRSASAGTAAGTAERDALDSHWSLRAAELRAVEDRLCFGRLDLTDPISGPATHHIGRIGLSDGRRQVQLDWRAPVAAAFYQATGAHPGAVARRRHIASTGRRVTELSDEVFEAAALPADAVVVDGRGALASALEAPRTGRMRDIVATVQAEQDRVVRAPLPGVLVVQGGPGTGKTAVALHRAAYLLYTHRDRIARSGVLLLGPTRAFLDYVSAVLPSLGESGVVAATPDTLVAGVEVTATESWQVAAIKGDARMARVLARAIRDRQQVPPRTRTIMVDGTPVRVEPRDIRAAQERARRTRRPHLAARRTYALDVLDTLARRMAATRNTDPDDEGHQHLVQLLRETPEIVRAVNRGWLPISPRRLVRELLTDPARLDAAAVGLRAAERALLLRPRDHGWTSADVLLLDEAADLLGEDDTAARAAAARAVAEQAQETAYAAEVLRSTGTGGLDAAALARRYSGSGSRSTLSVAERAEQDPTWAFGHVIVDEAQELSAMAWRAVFRRCPSKSLTVVGDIAQTGSAAGSRSWAQAFAPHVQDRFTVAELTVNYRTPGAVMDLAARVLAAAGPGLRAPRSARPGGDPPEMHRCRPDELADTVAAVVTDERRNRTDGTLAVITPAKFRGTLATRIPGTGDIQLLLTGEAKGLEFDDVVVVEPAAIVAESPRGLSDLYVALTRPTRHLHLVHAGPLPESLQASPVPEPVTEPVTADRLF
jgi:DNA helicase IV